MQVSSEAFDKTWYLYIATILLFQNFELQIWGIRQDHSMHIVGS